MGNWDNLTKLGTRRWEARGYSTSAQSRSEETPGAGESRYVCPACEQYFGFAGVCDRCRERLVDRSRALPARKDPMPSGWSSLPWRISPFMYLTGIVAGMFPLAYLPMHTSAFSDWLAVLGGLTGLCLLLPSATGLVLLTRRRRKKSRERREARSRAEQLPLQSVSELPERPSGPVRIFGRVDFEATPTGVSVRVIDDSGAARIADNSTLQAYSLRGELEELASLRDGDHAEVIGTGRQVHAAGGGYRAVEQEFEFDDRAPLEAWVDRAPA